MNTVDARADRGWKQIDLRVLREGDDAFLRAVYASTRTAELAATGWNAGQVDAFIDMQFEAQRSHYWRHYDTRRFRIIVCDGIDAGRLYVDRRGSDLRVVDIALLPSFRNRGIATRLFAALFDEADRDGLSVSIHVEFNNPAQSLYARLGFAVRSDAGEIHRLMERPPRIAALA
ncbi:MAG: GNAT family N-acetyltransferase [Dokdonella sp.]|uniref:GNAT family N-acetyltransferase n=1 Tax=Dokdonella sp. TaxID=2291710 RepID=UPI0025BAC924|nr:GNAT family N-acetyltransferase [Dokdonella sp.]MBZ0223841.1 GNAT family N-acetyltransferase [Dokdonella sp.]MCC7254955.1 GNAT family N-acetyltransferase [Dokdonella sp.]